MNTYEMVAQADKDGLTYRTDDMYYTKGQGFHDSEGKEWEVTAWDFKNGLSRFIHVDGWKPVIQLKKVGIYCKIDKQYCSNNLKIYLDGEHSYTLPMSGEQEARRFVDFIKKLVESNKNEVDLEVDFVKE